MKMVEISENLYLNPSDIKSVEFDDENNITRIRMVGEDTFILDLPIKKVLDAICGSEEHSITSKDGGDIYFSSKNITY